MDSSTIITIERHIVDVERLTGGSGEFSGVLRDLTLAAKIIWHDVNRAGLVNILGSTGRTNIHGDVVKKLDEFADATIRSAMEHAGHLCVMASEEHDDIIRIPDGYPTGKYVLVFDPLDGSSNIDANVTIGTIFSIFKRISAYGHGTIEDCLQMGYQQLAAGYVIFGSSTMLVYTTGRGVHGFTLDPSVGEFILSHENIRIPRRGKTYSINEGNSAYWYDGTRRFIGGLKAEDHATDRPYTARYVGSLVADFHRNLLYGGIYLYPSDRRNPDGKLRLVYEANPLAFIIEQAGGRASDGHRRILGIKPKDLHQRTPLIIGSDSDVLEAEDYIQGKRL